MKLEHRKARLMAAALMSIAIVRCKTEERGEAPATQPTAPSAIQSWDVCTLLGPQREMPGLYGTDLGITVALPATSTDTKGLARLFGDSWAAETDICAYPVLNADDLQAVLPAQRPNTLTVGQPTAAAMNACSTLTYPLDNPDDPTTWPRIRLFANGLDRTPENQLDTSTLRTPVAAWTDGKHTFGAFVRDEVARCNVSTDCPSQMICSKDAAYNGKRIGACQPEALLTLDSDPPFCISDSDCSAVSACGDIDFGVCMAAEPFTVERDGQAIRPSWYADDPRLGIALRLYLATALWPDRAQDYGTGFRFVTNKFVYPTIRTIAHFDPANPDNNDYRPGTETLLMWGRPRANALHGAQSLPYLLYQPLDGLLDDQGNLHWAPKFFAGYDETGNPRWSDLEADAQPVYGVDENVVTRDGISSFEWSKPEFDYVEQTSVAWVAPLRRWVMLYGGDPPAYIVADPKTGTKPEPVYAQTVPGAMYLRSARHPWGRSRRDVDAHEAWSDARPALTRRTMAGYLSCDAVEPNQAECSLEPAMHSPSDLLTALGMSAQLAPADWASLTTTCLAGNTALATQNSLGGDTAGHLYGANIVEEWTEDVTDRVSGLAKGSRAVELYWNVSTWNPYSVVLVKTQLRGSAQKID